MSATLGVLGAFLVLGGTIVGSLAIFGVGVLLCGGSAAVRGFVEARVENSRQKSAADLRIKLAAKRRE